MELNDKWVRDTGLIFALISLILGWQGNSVWYAVTAVFLLALVLNPNLLKPLAWVWLKVTLVLAYIMNRVFFGLVYFGVVTPIGFLRRLLGKDSLQLRSDSSRTSAFHVREGDITAQQMTRPF